MAPRVGFTKQQVKVVLNRKAIDDLTLGAADGLHELAATIIEEAEVPVAAEAHWIKKGVQVAPGHTARTGGSLAFVNGKQVGGRTRGGRDLEGNVRGTIGSRSAQIVVAGGFGFPGRLIEFGTAETAAHPFLTPALLARVPDAEAFIALAEAKRGYYSRLGAAKKAGATGTGKAFGAIRRVGPSLPGVKK